MGLFEFIRKTSFTRFFLSWIISIFFFMIIYFLLSPLSTMIPAQEPVNLSWTGLVRALFASFLIATIFGYGSIIHTGFISIIVYVQLACSIILVLILLDKIVQKYIVPGYHHMHHHEKKITHIMLTLSIFRQDIHKIVRENKNGMRRKIEIKEIEAIIDGLYVAFLDVEKMFSVKNVDRHKVKSHQYLMLAESIEACLESLEKFIEFSEKHDIVWKDKNTEFWIRYILETAEKIVFSIDTTKVKSPHVIIAIENMKEYAEKIENRL